MVPVIAQARIPRETPPRIRTPTIHTKKACNGIPIQKYVNMHYLQALVNFDLPRDWLDFIRLKYGPYIWSE